MKQLSNQELIWCRGVARKIRKAYKRYETAKSRLSRSSSLIFVSGGHRTNNPVEGAHVTVETWKEFEESLSSEERELLEEILYGIGDYFTKKEAVLLKGMNKKGKSMGVWK